MAPLSQFVAIRLEPARAELVVEAPNKEIAVASTVDGPEMPKALGQAAAFMTEAVSRLGVVPPVAKLRIVVARDTRIAQLYLDTGSPDPQVLVTLAPEPETLH